MGKGGLVIGLLAAGAAVFVYSNKTKAATETTSPPPNNNTPTDAFPLKIGSEGKNVVDLQQALKTLTVKQVKQGWDAVNTDGKFTSLTFSILNSLDTGLYPVTSQTFQKILMAAKEAASKNTTVHHSGIPAATSAPTKETKSAPTTEPVITFYNQFDKVFGLVKGPDSVIKDSVRILITEGIRNASGYAVELRNLMAHIETSVDGSTWDVVAQMPASVSSVKIADGHTVSAKLPIDFKLVDIQAVSNKKNRYRIITAYTINNKQKYFKSELNLQSVSTDIQSSLKTLFSLGAIESGPKMNLQML